MNAPPYASPPGPSLPPSRDRLRSAALGCLLLAAVHFALSYFFSLQLDNPSMQENSRLAMLIAAGLGTTWMPTSAPFATMHPATFVAAPNVET